MWFADTSSSQCTGIGGCWVESGISTWPANDPNSCHQGYDSVCLFFADNRPNPGSYHEHPLYYFGLDGIDLTPYYVIVEIKNHNSNSSSGVTWDVSDSVFKNGNFITRPSGQSTNNNMNTSNITVGSELSATVGSSSEGDIYSAYNQWLTSIGTWVYQTTTGKNGSTNPPPSGYWYVAPCNCSGNTGGLYLTYD